MTRSRRLALYVAAGNALVIGLLYVALYAAMSSGFGEVERLDAEERRLREAFAVEADQLGRIAGDWAPWDDTYAFVQGRNDAYVASNLVPSVVANLDIDFMLFRGTDGAFVHSFVADGVSADAALVRHLEERGDVSLRHDEGAVRTGIVTLEGTPTLVASAPIVGG